MTSPTASGSAGLNRAADPLRGIVLKVASVGLFVVMSSLLKATETIPAGEMVFFRAFFAIIPVMAWLAWRGQLRPALRTNNLPGHALRALVGVGSMGLGFYALTRLPLPETTAITYATPLLLVVLSVILLKERVHVFRWTAVIVGLAGVLVILWPRLTVFSSGAMGHEETMGAIAALAGAFLAAFAMLQVRRLVATERTEAIVVYFFIIACIISLVTLPFGWVVPNPYQAMLLVGAGFVGGIGQLLMTSSYRYADMSVIAPFEYTSLLLTIVIGMVVFDEWPSLTMLAGGAIIVLAGLAVILREHYLGLDRARARQANTP